MEVYEIAQALGWSIAEVIDYLSRELEVTK